MPDPTVLEFAVQSFTANQLAIRVKNSSGGALDKPLTIQFSAPKYLVDHRVRAAVEAAPHNPGGVTTLDTIVTGAEANFSVWANPETSGYFAGILLMNNKDKSQTDITPIALPAGAALTLLIPVDPQASHASVNLPYSYEYDDGELVSGELELKGTDTEWTPVVTFNVDDETPTVITPGTAVKIHWKIRDGVSATLRGPLPGGKTKRSLGRDEFESSMTITAVAPVTYSLQAEVKPPDGKPNVEVVKMLSLDVFTAAKYGYVAARAPRVLPLGLVEVDWAAWGVNYVIIEAEGGSRRINLTDMTASGTLQGVGVMRFNADEAAKSKSSEVKLLLEKDNRLQKAACTSFDVVAWEPVTTSFTGQPIGLAIAGPMMMLLTTDGLWIAEVGEYDLSTAGKKPTSFVFNRVAPTDPPKAWLGVGALGQRFVILKQTKDDDLQVAFSNSDGKPGDVVPIDLPADLRALMIRHPAVDLAVCNNRAYVAVEAQLQSGLVRRVFSVGVDDTKRAQYRNEPLLETMPGYRLLAFDNVLYALNRTSGHMFRLPLEGGRLVPYKAAAAIDQDGASMVKQGVLVPVGRVMAVLNPNSVPPLALLAKDGLQNVLSYQNLTPLKAAGELKQDVVYSPQTDRWLRCGHGIDATTGVVGYREGDSPRLWLIDSNAKTTHTLNVTSEHLFLYNYVTEEKSKTLAPYFNKTQRITLLNNTGMEFVLPDDACQRLGLTALSSSSPVEMVTPVTSIKAGITAFDLRYNDANAGPVVLRFMVQRAAGVKHDYVLELILSDPSLTKATTVFKRIAPQQYGGVSIAEVPGTREDFPVTHPDLPGTTVPIEFFPKPLVNGTRLSLRNGTPYQIWRRSPDAPNPADREKEYKGEEIKITYSTPAFSLYAHGAGELFFDVDFALPSGMEISFSEAKQQQRLRVRKDNSRGLIVDTLSAGDIAEVDFYKRTLRYKYDKPLSGVFIGDGVFSKDGASIYVPLAHAAWTDKTEITKYRAQDLLIEGHALIDGGEIFSAPNSVAVLSDRVLAAVRNNWIGELSPELKYKGGFPTSWHDVITNLKGSPEEKTFFTLGMKEKGEGAIKHSYSYAARTFPQQFDTDLVLDGQKGFRPPPSVAGTPAWVSPNTISPMDVWMNRLVALCVQGGMFQIVVNGKEITEVRIPEAGREEAVVIDADGGAYFCAHQSIDKRGLVVSRVNIGETDKRKTITLPGPVTGMLTNPKPPAEDLRYHCPRAVSLIATPDALFVSHARNILVLDKTSLEVLQTVPVNLPCRLIQVRRGKLSSETDPKYGTPRDCNIVWAIGSMYVGNGQDRKNHQTALYKIGIV